MSLEQLVAFGLTLGVEGFVAFLIAPFFGASRERALIAAMLGSAITHPVVWPAFYALWPQLKLWSYGVVEAYAVLAEMLVYRLATSVSWGRAFFLPLLVNGASVGAGFLMRALD